MQKTFMSVIAAAALLAVAGPAAAKTDIPLWHAMGGNLGDKLNAMVKACGGYFACVATCDCNDKSCLLGCVSKMDHTCLAAAPPQGQCEKAHCASACMAHR